MVEARGRAHLRMVDCSKYRGNMAILTCTLFKEHLRHSRLSLSTDCVRVSAHAPAAPTCACMHACMQAEQRRKTSLFPCSVRFYVHTQSFAYIAFNRDCWKLCGTHRRDLLVTWCATAALLSGQAFPPSQSWVPQFADPLHWYLKQGE